jgi:hypothetical protein
MTTTSVSIVEVGMPATLSVGSDRYPATVIGVTHFKSGARAGEVRTVTIQQDTATVSGGVWPDLEYEYSPNPDGRILLFFADSKGRFKTDGYRLALGHRRRYNDPHF